MQFTDYTHQTIFELLEDQSLRIRKTQTNPKALRVMYKFLLSRISMSPLEGGTRLAFSIEEKAEGYLLIRGNLFDAFNALSSISEISEDCKSNLFTMYSEMRAQELRDNVHPAL